MKALTDIFKESGMADFNKLKAMWEKKSTENQASEPEPVAKPKKSPGKLNLDAFNKQPVIPNPAQPQPWVKDPKPKSPIAQQQTIEK